MPTCKKCSSCFPHWLVIDGSRRNLRARRYCLECSPWGKGNSKRLDKYHIVDDVECKKCSVCQEWISLTNYYYSKLGYPGSACKTCQNNRTGKLARDIKQKAVNYKGGSCEDCSGIFAACIYDFHHIDPSEKDFQISGQGIRRLSWEKIQVELDKCALLCSNCHRLRHYNHA